MNIRNVAIIAHVDHGKTTLVDSLFKQYGNFRQNQVVNERAMDSNELEKERGITILAKCTSVIYKDYKINIIDTPGHADFGGEVERILDMVDGVILIVDSKEGPMPQTRFVTAKALSLGLVPILVVNKMDKEDRRPDEVCNEIFDLMVSLNATEEQLDFSILYAASRDGWVSSSQEIVTEDVSVLLETIVKCISSPKIIARDKFSLLVTMIAYDEYVGRMLIGKIWSASVKLGDTLHALDPNGEVVEKAKVTKIILFEGLDQVAVDSANAGDIISIAGFKVATVADTICDIEIKENIPSKPIDPPLLSMTFSVNTSPLAGKEGKKLTSRVIRDRLLKEQESNVSIKVMEADNSEQLEVYGRGELQLSILIETMRREGFELSIGRPRVLIKMENGVKMEPCEEVQIDVDVEFAGTIIDVMQKRRAKIVNVINFLDNKQRILFIAPTRGMIGYYSKFLTDTKGTGTMSRTFYAYEEWKGSIETRHKGVLVSMVDGKAAGYSLASLEERGELFVEPNELIYKGMVIGENAKDNDLEVNPIKGKQLTNMRASGKDDNIVLTPPKKMSLEEALCYIEDDELIEVTPLFIRLRKKYLNPTDRKRLS